ncbi:MAG TPA: LysM peptidoglycan-binding domain-containing protein [Acidimicrobiales bacterium]|nr:LysM peptidoglycan-binding domain-containing protein [Acidimicrobiales bacterium]
MVAVEIAETDWVLEPGAPSLRLVRVVGPPAPGPSLSQRRAARARMLRRRRRSLAALALALALGVLAMPGTSFGGVTNTGLPTDLATSAVLAPGTSYVVQPGDTVETIATKINPLNPTLARVALVRELDSNVVVVGEHVLIP